jgi:uncharacterized protein YbjT (DUF2867 family)
MVVKRLIERGHSAVGVSRSKPQLGELGGRFESRVGDMTDRNFVAASIQDCEGVITCLGQRRKSASFWSARTSPADILAAVTRAVVAAIGADASKHLVYLSAFGVGADLKKHSIIFRMILRSSRLWDAYQDHANAEKIMKSSHVSWTIVRPPGLTDAEKEVPLVDLGDRWSSFATVSRKSLARFLVECVENKATILKSMTIGEVKS